MTDRREPHVDDAEVVEGPVVEGQVVEGQVVEGELVPTDPTPNDPAVPDPQPAPVPEAGYTEVGYTAAGVPTFDHVRERIEGRIATAGGAGELDAVRPEVQDLEQQEADRAARGRDRLEEIRRSMRGDA